CLFLAGMMLLAGTSRREGLFCAVAAFAVNRAGGSPASLFALTYAAGVVVTVFLSNDATAVVLTPAVFAAARRARTAPLPHLLACAMVANAASFVLPISNPANLVLFASRLPPLADWLGAFAFASTLSVAATYVALRLAERRDLAGGCERAVPQPRLTRGAWAALVGLASAVAVLLGVSALGQPLGAPTAILAAAAAAGHPLGGAAAGGGSFRDGGGGRPHRRHGGARRLAAALGRGGAGLRDLDGRHCDGARRQPGQQPAGRPRRQPGRGAGARATAGRRRADDRRRPRPQPLGHRFAS